MEWFINHRPDLTENVACMRTPGNAERRLLSIVSRDQLRSVLRFMLDEMSSSRHTAFGAISRFHKNNPYILQVNGTRTGLTMNRQSRVQDSLAATRTAWPYLVSA